MTQSPDAAVSFGRQIYSPITRQWLGVAATDVSTIGLAKMVRRSSYGKTGAAMLFKAATGSLLGLSSNEYVVDGYSTLSANNVNVQLKHFYPRVA